MGAGQENTPAKPSKPTSSTQEPPPTPYPDWSNSMQAYYGAGATPPFFASTVASPTPHPYMWGSQHPLMPPYGTPIPYPALYPPGGVYAHPNMIAAPSMAQANAESDGKAPEGKDRASNKKSKGASGNALLTGAKVGDSGNGASGSGNDGGTQSAESGSEGSSDSSDENTNRHEFSSSKKGSFGQMLADANAQNNHAGATLQASSVPGNALVPVTGTNLNIGMDLWNSSPAGTGAMKIQPNSSGVSPALAPATMIGREGMMPDHQWIQDERELKRQKRKQSNRESARRSRLRKQAECEELQQRVETLSNENLVLREELQRLSKECEKLTSKNNVIKEELTRLCGPDAVSKLGVTSHPQSRADEGNS